VNLRLSPETGIQDYIDGGNKNARLTRARFFLSTHGSKLSNGPRQWIKQPADHLRWLSLHIAPRSI